jgi:ABC-2 type transport system permease protein
VVAGDTIAGEASQGTLRYLLVAPAGRLRLLVVKFIGTVAWALAATLTLVVSGLIIGSILFPVGPVTLLSGDVVGLGESLGRVMLVALYASISLVGLSAVGLFISTLTDVPVGAMAATVIVPIVSQILDALPQLSAVHPYLLTHYWLGFADLLRNPIEWSSFTSNALLQLGYIVVFGSLAYSRFATKSILS